MAVRFSRHWGSKICSFIFTFIHPFLTPNWLVNLNDLRFQRMTLKPESTLSPETQNKANVVAFYKSKPFMNLIWKMKKQIKQRALCEVLGKIYETFPCPAPLLKVIWKISVPSPPCRGQGEECDDMNKISGDGCSLFCQQEVSFNCIGKSLPCLWAWLVGGVR